MAATKWQLQVDVPLEYDTTILEILAQEARCSNNYRIGEIGGQSA
ncbi:MAG: hypothetical protein V3U76_18220 [Granulosicoccus sp.]